jgi:hypothetical protein
VPNTDTQIGGVANTHDDNGNLSVRERVAKIHHESGDAEQPPTTIKGILRRLGMPFTCPW